MNKASVDSKGSQLSRKHSRKGYRPKATRPGARLSERELLILKLAAKGLSKPEAGKRIGMTGHGVDWHIRQIFIKLRANTTANAVFKAYKAGILK